MKLVWRQSANQYDCVAVKDEIVESANGPVPRMRSQLIAYFKRHKDGIIRAAVATPELGTSEVAAFTTQQEAKDWCESMAWVAIAGGYFNG